MSQNIVSQLHLAKTDPHSIAQSLCDS